MPASLGVADIVRRHGDDYRRAMPAVSVAQRRVLTAIAQCRTAALGGHVEQCDRCPHTRVWYNSCRNRHCPACQGLARAHWIARREAELLDCEYFHVVFTVPAPIATLASQQKAVVYAILFRAAAQTLRTIAADPKHLGAEIGVLAVLHTWGQQLQHHPHLHCVVTGGGLSPDGARWVACRPGFFLPVRVLSRLFRRLVLQDLQQAFAAGQIGGLGARDSHRDAATFHAHMASARAVEWVVYAKRPFAGPAQVLAYLGHYTHRVAIANQRLIDLTDGHVRFRWKDYRCQARVKTMTLTATEFLRRFLLHVLPPGFQRIRYYGLLGNRHRADKLARCRRCLEMPAASAPPTDTLRDHRDRLEALTGVSLRRCPRCHEGHMIDVALAASPSTDAAVVNTS